MAPKNFTVEYKCELLNHLIDTSRTWKDPDLAAFFTHCRLSFDGLRGTSWDGHDLEDKLRNEERIWLSECEGQRPRRRGHEKGSYYHHLMLIWKKIWNDLLLRDWQNEIDSGRPWNEVPKSLRKDLRKKREEAPTDAQAKARGFEHDGDKVRSIVESAAKRARDANNPNLAEAVLDIYEQSRTNWDLRELMEAILTQTATQGQNVKFQGYVRATKKRLRQDRRAAALLKNGNTKAPVVIDLEAQSSNAIKEKVVIDLEAPTTEHQSPALKQNNSQSRIATPAAAVTDTVRSPSSRRSDRDRTVSEVRPRSSPSPSPRPLATQQIATEAEDNEATPHSQLIDIHMQDTAEAQIHPENNIAGIDASDKAPQSTDIDAANGTLKPASMPSVTGEGTQTRPTRAADEPSDSGYETTERQPHRAPLVTEVLGDLQYEASVQTLLAHDKPLRSDANIRTLHKRRSALEVIKSILVNHPAAKTDLQVLLERLQEMDAEGRPSEDPKEAQIRSRPKRKSRARKSEVETSDYENNESDSDKIIKDEEITPQSTRSLRARKSTSDFDVREQPPPDHDPRRKNGWPCPMAKDTGCTDWFSSSGHAKRHAMIHTGVKDFACPECEKQFVRKDNMMEHFRHVHNGRVTSHKRPRTSEVEVAAEADRQAAQRAAKRQMTTRSTTRRSVTNLGAGESRDSSPLTELTSEDDAAGATTVRPTEPAAADVPAHTSEPQLASLPSANASNRGIHPLWPVTEEDMAASRRQEAAAALSNGAIPSQKAERMKSHTEPLSLSRSSSPHRAITRPPNQPSIPRQPTVAPRDPAIVRLEAKIDSLLQGHAAGAHSSSPQDSEHAMVSSAESLLNIANSLKEGVLEGQNPDVTRMIARLTRTAAQAVIDAATSAKRSAEMARDISFMLEQTASTAEQATEQARAGAAQVEAIMNNL